MHVADQNRIENSTPVLILSANSPLNTLGILRSLGEWAVSLYVVDGHLGRASFSRYCKNTFIFNALQERGFRTVEFLCDVSKHIGRKAVLIPTFDEGALLIAQYRDVLQHHYLFPLQDVDVLRSVVDKKQMYCVAKRLGIPVPETAFPQSKQDVLDFVQHATFPVVLKPTHGTHLKIRCGKNLFVTRTSDQLLELYESLEESNRPFLMLQEYLPGPDTNDWGFHGYFDSRAECVLGFTGTKLHQTPVHTGITSLGVCLQNPEVDEISRRLMTRLRYKGIINLDLRFDGRDGTYKMLDVNPRIGAIFRSYLTQNNLDVARAAYLDLTGQTVTRSEPRYGRKWAVEIDIKSLRAYHREGKPLRKWLHDYRGIDEMAYISIKDPLPFICLCLSAVFRPIVRLRSFFTSLYARRLLRYCQ